MSSSFSNLFEVRDDQQTRYSLDILSHIKQSQLANGLRHNDFRRYRQYCTRRLKRVRAVLKFQLSNHHANDRFIQRDLPRTIDNPLWLVYLLTQVERSWAYAQELNEERLNDKENLRKRFHLIKKLRRACSNSNILEQACHAFADTRTQLQAEAYSLEMNGALNVELGDFERALTQFTQANAIYVNLGKVAGSDLQALCEERVAHQADQIRVIKYSLKMNNQSHVEEEDDDMISLDNNAMLSAKMQALMRERDDRQAASIDSVQWADTSVPVANEKLRVALLRIRRLREQGKKLNVGSNTSINSADEETGPQTLSGLYSSIASTYDEALRIVKDELSEVKLEAHRTNLLALQCYCQYERANAMKHRNRLFAQSLRARFHAFSSIAQSKTSTKKTKPDELVLVFEKILANLSEMKDAASTQPSFANLIQQQTVLYEAWRLYYVAESYRRSKKYAESFALFQLVSERARTANNITTQNTDPDMDIASEIAELESQAIAAKVLVQSTAVLESQSSTVTNTADSNEADVPSLLQRLDQFRTGIEADQLRLADWPPSYKSVPCKPVFFDLAYNYLEYPEIHSKKPSTEQHQVASSDHKAQQADDDSQQASASSPTSGGLLGAVSGLGKWVGWGR